MRTEVDAQRLRTPSNRRLLSPRGAAEPPAEVDPHRLRARTNRWALSSRGAAMRAEVDAQRPRAGSRGHVLSRRGTAQLTPEADLMTDACHHPGMQSALPVPTLAAADRVTKRAAAASARRQPEFHRASRKVGWGWCVARG